MKKNYFLILILFLISKMALAQEPYVGEIRMFAGDFAPQGWEFCNGQTMSISGNDVLFTVIGTTYGGDGFTTFKLPDLRGRVPVGTGQGPDLINRTIGTQFGAEGVKMNVSNLPAHSHQYQAKVNNQSATTSVSVANSNIATSGFNSGRVTIPNSSYTDSNTNLVNNSAAVKIQNSGKGDLIPLVKPYFSINYIIATIGNFPSQE